MSEKQEKKAVGRTVAIALGIICIILAVGLVGAIADYTSIINGKDNTIATLTNQGNQLQTWLSGNETLLNQIKTWLDENKTSLSLTQTWLNANVTLYNNYVANHHYSDSDYDSLITQITNLQNQVTDLTNIVNLVKSTTWANEETVSQPANSYTSWTFSASYAGYVSVWVQSSSATDTRVRVIYTSHGVNYDGEIGVGSGGTAIFPLLPSSNIEIRVGNHNLVSGATETVTITYYY